MKQFIYILFISILLFGVSCTKDEECRKNRYVNMGVGLYHVSYNATTDTYSKSTLSIDSLTLRGINVDTLSGNETLVDSILYNNKKSISKLVLPLNKLKNQSKYLVQFNQVIDTITILYRKFDYYLSLECGCIKTFSIDTVLTTNNYIDSVRIINHDVNNNNEEHLQIYN
ncbi:MAG: hypothetical protein GZ091_06720 [Paludibacter sp.]|nr:hypothetical protein [Paludibacter sp.]